ncbi:hypothetical protein LINPERHAP1_LOCUS13171 [Linum perenne]
MRFLFDFVSCCGSLGHDNPHAKEVPAIRSEEDTRALVSQPANVAGGVDSTVNRAGSGQNRTRKRSRAGSSDVGTGKSGENWKPTLKAISEDNAAAEEKLKRREKEKAVKRKGRVGSFGRRSGSRDSSYCYGDDYRGSSNQFAGVFPGFSATPFMI